MARQGVRRHRDLQKRPLAARAVEEAAEGMWASRCESVGVGYNHKLEDLVHPLLTDGGHSQKNAACDDAASTAEKNTAKAGSVDHKAMTCRQVSCAFCELKRRTQDDPMRMGFEYAWKRPSLSTLT
eukprot:CAMPEP_0183337930 /NCGR_PEP_ID=MMETSP0164_2-20130417/5407_1 /TAXON_ID=221442 /ORGANISM="Coccolithus pelagicus ssp braarudi, Strain PLY182g" /LENGTH=125 /DNA_ID=CAMNT_0025507703 /DNA_START=272 /DNA_END=647 /DNA_ORIENTATION=+